MDGGLQHYQLSFGDYHTSVYALRAYTLKTECRSA